MEGGKGRAQLLTDAVNVIKTSLALLIQLKAIALGMGSPRLLPHPHLPVDLPTDDVVLQQVALVAADARKACFQAAEHILVLKAARHRLHGGEEHGDDRLLRQVAAAAHVGADAVTVQHHFQQCAVTLHVTGRHGDVAVAIALLRHKAANLTADILHLGVGVGSFIEGNGLLRPLSLIGNVETEKTMLQMVEGGSVCFLTMLDVNFHAHFPRHTHQTLTLSKSVLEKFRILGITQQRHRHAMAAAQCVGEDMFFLLGEEGKSV